MSSPSRPSDAPPPEPVPETLRAPRSRLPWPLRVLLVVLLWTGATATALLGSAALHLDSPPARRLAAELLSRFVSGEVQGSLRIGRIDHLSPFEVVARHVELRDRAGRKVAAVGTVRAALDLPALLDGSLHFREGILEAPSIRLIESDEGALPTLITLFEPTDTSPSTGDPLHAQVDRIEMRDGRVRGELLGLRGIVAEQVHLVARLEAQHELRIDILEGHGRLTRPFPFVGRLDLSAAISTDPYVGFTLRADGRRPDRPEESAHAELTLRLPAGADPDDSTPMALRIHSERISADSLRGLGYDWAAPLTGAFRGDLELRGVPAEKLHISGALRSDGGPVSLEGELPTEGTVRIDFETPGIDVHRVLDGAPELHAGGHVALFVEDDPKAPVRARLDLLAFRWGEWQVPPVHVEGRLLEDGFAVDELAALEAGGRLRGHGKLWWDGRVRLRIHAHRLRLLREPNARARTGGASGLATASVLVRRDPGPPARLLIEGPVTVENFRRGPIRAARLQLDGWLRVVETGPEQSRLTLHYEGRSERTSAWDADIGSGSLIVDGDAGRYDVRATLQGGSIRAFAMRALLEELPNGYRYQVPELRATVGPHAFSGHIESGLLGAVQTAVEGLRLQSGAQRIALTLRLGRRDAFQMDLRTRQLDLQAVLGALAPGTPRVGGRLDLQVQASETWSHPRLDLQASVRDGRFEGVRGVALDVVAHHEPSGELRIEGQADLGREGHLSLSGLLWLPTDATDLRDGFNRALYDVDVGLLHVPLSTVIAAAGAEPVDGLRGTLGGHVQFDGLLDAPALTMALRVPRLELPGLPPLSTWGQLSYENGSGSVLLTVGDERGELLQAEMASLLDLVHLIEAPSEAIASLESAPWRIAARLASRRLSRWPLPVLEQLPRELKDVRVGASLVLQGGALASRGELLAAAHWGPEGLDSDCGPVIHPRAQLEVTLRGERTEARLGLFDGSRAVARLSARARTPLIEWLAQARITRPPVVDFDANLADLDVGRLPHLCSAMRGPLGGVIHGRDLFGASPRIEAELRTDELVLRRFGERGPRGKRPLETETPPAVTRAWVKMDHRDLRANATLQWPTGGTTRLSALVPVRWPRRALHPVAGDTDQVAVDVAMDATPLGPLLVRLPGFVDAEGRVDGQVRIEGVFSEPKPFGEVQLQGGRLGIAPLGQQLRDVEGRVVLHGDWAEIQEMKAYDADGELGVRGSTRLRRLLPHDLRLVIESDLFPIRDEGSVLATLSGRALLDGVYEDGELVGELMVQRLAVRLPDESNRSLQPIEPHPDVQLVRGGVDFGEPDEEEPFHLRLRLRSERPFWVSRTDLAVLVETDIVADWRDPDLRLEGFLQVRRGYFEVFGKRFDVQRARMDFLGDVGVNPEVALVGVHELSGRQNGTVTVTVTGRLAEPVVEFTTSVPDCQQRSQVIMLLLSGQCGLERQAGAEEQERRAGEQAARFLSGILAGVLTLTARTEFGDLVPMLAVESGQQVGSARVRAGWQADSLVPDFLRDVVRSVYVEGYLVTAGSDTQRTGSSQQGTTDLGALIELQFPHRLVGRGVVSSSGRWSVDLTYEP